MLEGIGGQVDSPGAPAAEHGVPVDRGSVDVGLAERGHQRGGFAAVPAECGCERRCHAIVSAGERFLGKSGEDAVGAELKVGGDSGGVQAGDRVGEADRVTDVTHPVLDTTKFVGGGEPAGQVRDDRYLGLGVGERSGDLAELVEYAVDMGGVEGVADHKPLGPASPGPELTGDAQGRDLVAGDDNGARPVDGGDTDAVVVRRECGAYLVFRRLDGDHRTAGRKRLHEPAPGRDDSCRVGEGPDTGDVGGGEFADRVPGEIVRPDVPGFEQPEQRGFDGEQRGLGENGLVDKTGAAVCAGVVVGEKDVADGAGDLPRQLLVQLMRDGVEGVREYRIGLVQLPAHAEPLAALAGEQERQFPRRRRGAGGRVRCRLAAGERAQAGQEAVPVVGDDDGAVLKRGPGGGQ